jgi:hypothetical protein
VSTLGRKLKYSINPDLIDRNEGGDDRLYTRGWVTPRALRPIWRGP